MGGGLQRFQIYLGQCNTTKRQSKQQQKLKPLLYELLPNALKVEKCAFQNLQILPLMLHEPMEKYQG